MTRVLVIFIIWILGQNIRLIARKYRSHRVFIVNSHETETCFELYTLLTSLITVANSFKSRT